MAIREILTFPNPKLRQKTETVETFDMELERLVEDMFDTMYDAPGVGLAANQIGISLRVAVLDVNYEVEGEDELTRRLRNKNPQVFINPALLEKSGKILFKEGCLSVPGFSEQVNRFEKVRLSFQDVTGKLCELNAEGLLAIAIQHEIDHLEGRLYLDRLSEVKKMRIKGKLIKNRSKKFERSKFHVEL